MCLVHVLWLSLNAKRRKCLLYHGHSVVGFLPTGSGEVEKEEGDAWLEKNVSCHGTMQSELVPLETLTPHTFSSSSWKKRVRMLIRAALWWLEPLKNFTDAGLELNLKKRKLWRCFSRVVWNFWDVFEAKDLSCIRHENGRYHPCVRCKISSESMVHGEKDRLVCLQQKLRRKHNYRAWKW